MIQGPFFALTHSDSAHGADVILDGFLENGEASIHVDFLIRLNFWSQNLTFLVTNLEFRFTNQQDLVTKFRYLAPLTLAASS